MAAELTTAILWHSTSAAMQTVNWVAYIMRSDFVPQWQNSGALWSVFIFVKCCRQTSCLCCFWCFYSLCVMASCLHLSLVISFPDPGFKLTSFSRCVCLPLVSCPVLRTCLVPLTQFILLFLLPIESDANRC